MARGRGPGMECEAGQSQFYCPQGACQDTHPGADSTVDRNHDTHDEVAEHECTNRHSPAEASGDHGGCYAILSASAETTAWIREAGRLTNFPVGDTPTISHPVGKICRGTPCAL